MHYLAMATNDESVCCQEISKLGQIVEEFKSEITPITCITRHPSLEAGYVNVWMLQIAYLQYHQNYGVFEKTVHQ